MVYVKTENIPSFPTLCLLGEIGNNVYAIFFFFGGGGEGINKVYYGLCKNGEFSTKTTELVQPCPQGFSGSDFFW